MTEQAMLTCQELVELVTEYVEGALSPEERGQFEAHLRECDPCVEYVAQMRRTIEIAGRMAPEDVDAGTRDHLLAHFRAWRNDRAIGSGTDSEAR